MARGAGLEELRRAVARLDRLGDALVFTTQGPVLLAVAGVRDPERLLAACRAGALDLVVLRAGLVLRRDPRPLSAALVARAHRDLKAIAATPEHVELIRDAPRSLRRTITRGPGWLDERWSLLGRLSRALAGPEPDLSPHADDADDLTDLAARSPWLRSALDLVAAAHGPPAARAALDLLRRSLSARPADLREPRRRVDALLRRLVADLRPTTRDRPLDLALADLARDARAPGPARQRLRRLRTAVLTALCWPAPPPSADPAPEVELPDPPAGARPFDLSSATCAPLRAALRAYGDAAARALFAPLDRQARGDLELALAAAALAFRAEPDARPWGRREAELAARLPALRDALPPELDLRLSDALWLVGADLPEGAPSLLARWLAEGLTTREVEAAIAAGKLAELLRCKGPAPARRYCLFVAQLAPRFKELGVDLTLEPHQVDALPEGPRGELGLLAHCLLQHTGSPTPAAVQRELAVLDATLGLFHGVPHAARALVERVTAAPAGRGRALHPEFAAWLGADDDLDHYCHLRALLGDPPELSNNLRSDFEAEARLLGQLEHLQRLPAPTPLQQALQLRLADKLARGELPGPEWTRRRLAEQVEGLRARAFRRQLDGALRHVLRAAFGVDIPELTPTWRDVVRFSLSGGWARRDAARNRELLGELVRAAVAAPGRPVARTWPKNQAWIAAARARLDPDAWLAPRRVAARIGDRACVLAAEDDPLEALRMGIPFDTCLSLRNGVNAASAVLNAVDVNKRVLYLRAQDGTILARQLLAVSADHRLLRYRVYTAFSGEEDDEAEQLFARFTEQLRLAAGLELSDEGAPAALHGGFWYDDGPIAAHADRDEGAALLAARGLPLGRERAWERRQVASLAVLARGDPEAALDLLNEHSGPTRLALARLALVRLGRPALRARARHHPAAAQVVLLDLLGRLDVEPANRPASPPPTLQDAGDAAPAARAPHRHVPQDIHPTPPEPSATAPRTESPASPQRPSPHNPPPRSSPPPPEPSANAPRAGSPDAPPRSSPASPRDPVDAMVAGLAFAAELPPQPRFADIVVAAEADAPASAAIARAWIGAAERLVRAGDEFDDGITHLTFSLGRHLACLPLGAFFDAAARLEALWERFLIEAPYCTHCRDRARRELALAAEAILRRERDPRPVLAALSAGRSPAAELALHLAARAPLDRLVLRDMSFSTSSEPLAPAAAADALARLGRPPGPCPPALSALHDLRRRRPDLARGADAWAALLRHHDPRRPAFAPADPPPPGLFAACAELVLHAPERLAPFALVGVPPSEWAPDRWELALHRRCPTPWRRTLARAAARGDLCAQVWLGLLGEPASGPLPPPGDQVRAPKLAPDAAAACGAATTRALAGELALPDLALALRPLRERAPQLLDPALLAAAARTFRDAVSEDMPEATFSAALDLLADGDHERWLAALDLLLAAPPRPWHAAIARDLLRRIHTYRPLSGPQILGLWRLGGARPALLDALTTRHRDSFDETLTALLRLSREGEVRALLSAWIAAQHAAGAWIDHLTCDAAPPGLLAEAALAGAGGVGWFRVYDAAPPVEQLDLLERLAALPPETRAEIARAAASEGSQPDLGRQWLLARCPEPASP